MKNYFLITLISICCISCNYYIHAPAVKKKYVYEYSFRVNKNLDPVKWRKMKINSEYFAYDSNGNEIEWGTYGERSRLRKQHENPDGSISVTSYSNIKPNNLNTVTYSSYNDSHQVIQEEYWRFRDNKKDELVYRTEFVYENNQLIREVEFSESGEITREKLYDTLTNVQIDAVEKSLYSPKVRVSGESRDSVTYDQNGRLIESYLYFRGKFLRRTVWVYNDLSDITTTYMYDNHPDSLWCYTEIKYHYLTKEPIRRHWKVLNTSTETIDVYQYNRKLLLKKILHYRINLEGKQELRDYTLYKYELFK